MLTGQGHRPLKGAPGDVVVLVFSAVDCPIANAVAPELQRVTARARALGARAFLVHVDVTLSDDDAARHAREYGLDLPVLIDREHRLVTTLGASTTPEGMVLRFDAVGSPQLRYRGRVNDLYVSLGRRRAQVNRHDLLEALDAVAADEPVPFEAELAVGCLIEPLP